MIHSLANDVHFAWRGDDVVVLSVPEDAYACFVGGAAYLAPASLGQVHISSAEAAADLLAAGLIKGGAAQPRTMATPARREAATATRVRWPSTAAFVLRSILAGRAYHGRSLASIIASARRIRSQAPATAARLAPCIAAYQAGLPWVPHQEACLHRAFLLLNHLARSGIPADWVFGVHTWPFLAHCWIQVGDEVIGDDPARIRRYTPILTV